MHYNHDCDQCVSLGEHLEPEGSNCAGTYDLYWCGKSLPTVVARHGNQPEDCLSGLHATHIGPLDEAKRRAREQGLIITWKRSDKDTESPL